MIFEKEVFSKSVKIITKYQERLKKAKNTIKIFKTFSIFVENFEQKGQIDKKANFPTTIDGKQFFLSWTLYVKQMRISNVIHSYSFYSKFSISRSLYSTANWISSPVCPMDS